MNRIFISYGSQDRELARAFADGLQALACEVWWDRSTPIGNRWDREIEKELKAATCVVVIWTRSSKDSEWVSNEAAVALRRNTLFPVLVDGVDPPLEFLRRQAARIETAPEPQFKEALSALLNLISATSRRRLAAVTDAPEPNDWRFSGGFEAGDPLLTKLPKDRPTNLTRYELARSIYEQSLPKGVDFKSKAREVFDLFTSDGTHESPPDQRDGTIAILLAHQLTEEYSKFGKQIRNALTSRAKDDKIFIPRCFNRVYLNTVNTFIKDIFSLLPSKEALQRLGISAQEQDIAAASRHIIKCTRIESRGSGDKAFAGPEIHATYALGRLRPNLPFMGVQDMLAKFESRLDKRLESSEGDEDDFVRKLRLMRRTVLLSRAMLGRKDSLKRYIFLVQNNFLETDVNAGFHLEYYCDQPRDERLPLCSRDDGQSCQKTLSYLVESLQQALSGDLNRSKSPLYLVEAYTLASIVARRLHGMHDESVRKSLPVIEKLHRRIEDEDSKNFLGLLLDVASSGPQYADIEFGRFLAAKNAPRNGWCNRSVHFPETVGAHTASVLWLCRLLPRLDFPNINVSRVRRMLEVHDLAEGITSDIVATHPREGIERIERSLMRRFSWLGLYMDPRVDLFDTFSLYEEFSQQQTQEAKVARDIDKLDILVQGWSLLKTKATFDRNSVTEMLQRTEAALVTDEVKAILPKVRVMQIISEEAFRTTPGGGIKEYFFDKRVGADYEMSRTPIGG